MPRTIDYYFSHASPWAYLGHQPFLEIARRHGAAVNYKPVYLRRVLAETGGVRLPKRHPARQHYRLVDLKRWREKRNRPKFNLQPDLPDFDPSLVDRFAIAIVMAHGDPGDFIERTLCAIWETECDVDDEAVVASLAREVGLDPGPLLASARDSMTEALYVLNMENAVDRDVFGSPSYVLDGEVFWGQDRLDLLDDALGSGRPPFRAE